MDTPNSNNPTGDKKDSQNIGILAYLGPLVIIPFLTSKDDPFVKFHVKQGLVLFIIEIIIMFIVPMFFWPMWQLLQLLNFLTLVLAIIGIVNVIQKREKMLPIIGGLSSYLKF